MSDGLGKQTPRRRSQAFPAGEKVRRFAWLPRKISNGSWIWLKSYYVRFPYMLDPEATKRARRRIF